MLIFFFIGKLNSKIIIKGTLNQIGYAVAQLEDKIYKVRLQAGLKHERAPNTRMLISSANKDIENEIEDKIYEEIYDEMNEETYDEIFGEIDDKVDDVDCLEEIISSSISHKEWEEFIERSGKTIEQIKKDFGNIEIIIEEDPTSPGMYVQCFSFFYFDNLFLFYYYVLVYSILLQLPFV